MKKRTMCGFFFTFTGLNSKAMKWIVTTTLLVSFSLFLYGTNDTTLYLGANGRIHPEGFQQFKKTIQYLSAKRIRVTTYSNTAGHWIKCLTETYRETAPDTYRVKAKTQNSTSQKTIRFAAVEKDLYRFTEKQENQLIRTGTTKSKIPFILHGTVIVYYPGGNKRSESEYHNNELVSNKNWLEDGQDYYDNIFYSVDQQPEFIPGADSIKNHLLRAYKEYQIDLHKIDGNLTLGFVVFENGRIGGFQLENGIHPGIDQITLNAFKTLVGPWKPARLNGKPVRYYNRFPVNFTNIEYHGFDYFDIMFL
jgi:hypothetical protein